MNRPGPQGGAARAVRRYHFHAPGIVYVGVTLFLAVGAINSQNNLLFAALGLAIGGLLVSGIISGASLLGLRIERDPIVHAVAGAPLAISYTVTNTNRFFPAFGLTVLELPAPGEKPWQRAMPVPRAFVAQVSPRRSVRAQAVVTPTLRGRIEFVSVRIWTTFPFGLARKSVTFELPAAAIVRPVELPLRREVIEELSAPATWGEGAERLPGHGDEFFALREYTPGDSLRRISWRRSARTGDLVVRQEALPAPMKLWVVLLLQRADATVAAGALRERAIALAAALVRSASASGMAIGLVAPGVARPPRTGHRHVDLLVCDLAVSEGAEPVDVSAVAGRSGACVVVSAGAPAPGIIAHRSRTLQAESIASLVVRELAQPGLTLLGSSEAPPGVAQSTTRGAAA